MANYFGGRADLYDNKIVMFLTEKKKKKSIGMTIGTFTEY